MGDDLTTPFPTPAASPSTVLRSAGAYGVLLAGLGLSVGTAVLTRDRRRGMNLALAWAMPSFLAVAGVRLDVQGAEILQSTRPAVVLMNHQSELDLVVLSTLMERDVTGVGKQELRANPVAATIGWLGDFAFIDRGDTASAIEALQPVVEELRAGRSLGIAAEGHRSDRPMPGPFKVGAFHIAMQAGVPIVPVVLRNTGELMPPGARFVSPGTVQVVVLEPIPSEALAVETVHEDAGRLRERFIEVLSDWPTSTRG